MSEQKDFKPMMSEEDVLIITRITQADAPYNQRAQALLAINQGKTDEEAAEASGLRATQVKYWVTHYGKSGVAIFPEELLADEVVEVVEVVEIETAVSSQEPTLEQAPSSQKEAKKKKKPKGEKAKEDKGEKQAASTAEEAPVDEAPAEETK